MAKTKWIVIGILIIIALIVLDVARRAYLGEEHATGPVVGSQGSLKQSTPPQSWRLFAADDFHVMLPTLPQHAAEATPLASGGGAITYDMYLAQDHDGTSFMISQTHFPNQYNTSNPQVLLDSVLKQMVQAHPKSVLVHQTNGTFQNAPSLDFLIQSGNAFMRGRAFLEGKTLFVLLVLHNSMTDIESLFSHFAGSFTLMAQPAPAMPAPVPVAPTVPAR